MNIKEKYIQSGIIFNFLFGVFKYWYSNKLYQEIEIPTIFRQMWVAR